MTSRKTTKRKTTTATAKAKGKETASSKSKKTEVSDSNTLQKEDSAVATPAPIYISEESDDGDTGDDTNEEVSIVPNFTSTPIEPKKL